MGALVRCDSGIRKVLETMSTCHTHAHRQSMLYGYEGISSQRFLRSTWYVVFWCLFGRNWYPWLQPGQVEIKRNTGRPRDGGSRQRFQVRMLLGVVDVVCFSVMRTVWLIFRYLCNVHRTEIKPFRICRWMVDDALYTWWRPPDEH